MPIITKTLISLVFLERIDINFIQRNRHNILKDGRLLDGYLIKYKNEPTKQIINKIHIEAFKLT